MFPGGARIRPQLCLAVAKACGDDDEDLSTAAAAAIELLLACLSVPTMRLIRPRFVPGLFNRVGKLLSTLPSVAGGSAFPKT